MEKYSFVIYRKSWIDGKINKFRIIRKNYISITNIKFIENGPFFRHPHSPFTHSPNRRHFAQYEALDYNFAPKTSEGFFSPKNIAQERVLNNESTNKSAEPEDSTNFQQHGVEPGDFPSIEHDGERK